MNIIRRLWRRFRSAVTGRFVTEEYAKTHKDTTIEEKRP